jgi:hypothetical protein
MADGREKQRVVAAAAVLLLLLSSMTTKMREPSEDFNDALLVLGHGLAGNVHTWRTPTYM